MKDITISFPGVKALDGVDFITETGRTHALIGANGAGKSTLMKVLSGAYGHYTGEIEIGGEKVEIRTPKDAQDHGIQIVYQEVDTALVPYLTVGENIMLNQMVSGMGKRQFINYQQIHNEATNILRSMNMEVSSKQLVNELTLAEKQMTLIARAISSKCKFLILDEPTAPLSQSETDKLFEIVKDLREKNVGIIFISHRLPELFQTCDDITIMRNGQHIIQEKIDETNINRVVEHMIGKKLDEQFPTIDKEIGQMMLEVKNLSDANKVKDINLHAKSGEIIGLAGLVGAGKTEICKVLFGSTKKVTGEIYLHGKSMKINNPRAAVANGFALVPEERRKEAVLVLENVSTNLTASYLTEFLKVFSFLDFKKEKEISEKMIKDIGIKTPSVETKVQNLSGGNQQKVAIGKWLISDADVYIFDEPTKGIDVGSKKDVYKLIIELAKRGKVIIYASSELPEIMGITDRSYVIYDGEIVKELETKATNEEELLYFSAGGK